MTDEPENVVRIGRMLECYSASALAHSIALRHAIPYYKALVIAEWLWTHPDREWQVAKSMQDVPRGRCLECNVGFREFIACTRRRFDKPDFYACRWSDLSPDVPAAPDIAWPAACEGWTASARATDPKPAREAPSSPPIPSSTGWTTR